MAHSSLNFAAHMLTCPERSGIVPETLRSFAASDWGEAPRIHVDLREGAPSRQRIAAAFGRMLRVAAEEDADFTLFLEDEIAVNRHLRHNLCAWEPVQRGELVLGSLYNREVAHVAGYESEEDGNARSFIVEARTVLGAHGIVLSREFLTFAAAHWADVGGAQSRRLVRLAAEFGPMHYHNPSLVQHIATDGLLGRRIPLAADFDLDWCAPARVASANES